MALGFAGGCSAAFARLAAVPCNNLEPDLGSPPLAGGFSPGGGLKLDELNLEVAAPVPRLKEVPCLLLVVLVEVLFSAGLPPLGMRAFARLDAVGLLGVPVTWVFIVAGG